MIMLIEDSEYARYILSLHTTGVCYKQTFNNRMYTPCEHSFETNPFFTPLLNLPVNKRLRKGVLAIRRIFSLVDMITKPKFSNCPYVFKIGLFR